jgi:hypothetical protein
MNEVLSWTKVQVNQLYSPVFVIAAEKSRNRASHEHENGDSQQSHNRESCNWKISLLDDGENGGMLLKIIAIL